MAGFLSEPSPLPDRHQSPVWARELVPALAFEPALGLALVFGPLAFRAGRDYFGAQPLRQSEAR